MRWPGRGQVSVVGLYTGPAPFRGSICKIFPNELFKRTTRSGERLEHSANRPRMSPKPADKQIWEGRQGGQPPLFGSVRSAKPLALATGDA